MTSEVLCSLAKKKGWGWGVAGQRGGRADAFAQGNLLKTGLSQTKKMLLAVGFESLFPFFF